MHRIAGNGLEAGGGPAADMAGGHTGRGEGRPGALRITTPAVFRLLLWVRWRALLAGIRRIRETSRLLLVVLGGFIAAYLLGGYWLFYRGLLYINQFPLVGAMLAQRLLFLIFGFVFVMLIFSNLITGYTVLFRNRETAFLLTLPVPHVVVYRWKFVESLVVSSWALLFLSAPLMVAYGRVFHLGPLFYVGVVVGYVPFLVLPGLIGSWAIMALVRVLSRVWVKRGLVLLGVALLAVLVLVVRPVTDVEAALEQEALSFDTLLKHTRPSLNPFLPSAWLAQCLLMWGDGLVRQGLFYFLLLASYALMGLWLGFQVVGGFFYPTWSAAVSLRTWRQRRRAGRLRRGRAGGRTFAGHGRRWLPTGLRPVQALCGKDARLFVRDPAQWTQFLIFFGLLCVYVLNLRNVAFDVGSDFWEMLISYLNLTASALTLSTLTTRFVFPQFSLEGRRLWIIGLAPLGLRGLLWQKFGLACAFCLSITASLMATSCVMLRLGWKKTAFFVAAITLMSITLCGLAAGLGALFPNLKEENPSKIVSGFGGTLCLLLSFVYIAGMVALLVLPAIHRTLHLAPLVPDAAAFAGAAGWSALFFAGSMMPALCRVKNLEI